MTTCGILFVPMPDLIERLPETLPTIPAVEHVPTPEVVHEVPVTERSAAEVTVPVAPVQPVAPVTPTADMVQTPALRQNVERILSEGLEETFRTLDAEHQQAFKETGEVTAAKIETMLQSAKVQVIKIIELIMTWLKIIPGVNKYFLEQEAKNKADKLLRLRADR